MDMSKITGTEHKMLFVINRLVKKGLYGGRLKLMKIMFFLEHFSFECNSLVSNKLFNKSDFFIHKFGPFSFDVMDGISDMKKGGLIKETDDSSTKLATLTQMGTQTVESLNDSMSTDLIKRVDKVIELFGEKCGKELERLSLEYLKIKPEEKINYIGKSVSEIIESHQ